MPEPVLKRKVPWVQGRFAPRNPAKYIGNPSNIVYRSSWERSFLHWCDITNQVVRWSSEELVIPYQSPVDGQMHRYFVDFIVWLATPDGIQKYAVEIKPKAECIPPKPPKRKSLNEAYLRRLQTDEDNQAKGKHAEAWCKSHGFRFIILTENELCKKDKR